MTDTASRWVLDTNIISELMKPAPAPTVLAWLDAQPQSALFITSITIMEIRAGLSAMPPSRRRDGLEAAFRDMVAEDFPGRVLPLDAVSADLAGQLLAARAAQGRPVGDRDTMIAAMAVTGNMGIATRNVRDFAGLPVPVLNPFDAVR